MLNKLPYQTTKGVVATREGLYFKGSTNAKLVMHPAILLGDPYNGVYGDYWVYWPAVAERLRYREGEPSTYVTVNDVEVFRNKPPFQDLVYSNSRLHRIAAILCDNAEAFRVLHWCVHNLPENTHE